MSEMATENFIQESIFSIWY